MEHISSNCFMQILIPMEEIALDLENHTFI